MVMDGRGVPEVLAELRAHGIQHLREHRGGRVVVEVNPAHLAILRAWAVIPVGLIS